MTEEAKTEVAETVETGAPEAEVEKVVETAADTVQDDDEGKTPEVADEEDGDPADADTDEDDAKPKRLSRTARLNRQKQALALENEQLRRKLAERDSSPEAKAPREEDFNGDFQAYERAMIAHDVAKALRSDMDKDRTASLESRKAELRQELEVEHQARIAEARKVLPDFDKTVREGLSVPMRDEVLDLLVESEKGPLIAYHLAKNPDRVKDLANMTALEAAKFIGKLETRLSLPNPKKQTQAPAPATPVKGGASPAPDPNKMDMDQYIKWRNAKAS